jgi:predicted nucleic acid-binding protein
VTLPDTSAWIEYIRNTGSAAHKELARLIEIGAEICTTDVVIMEVLAGARSNTEYRQYGRLLARFELAGVESPWDYIAAADLYRACRAGGSTIRKMNDCLIAAVAIRHGAELLHQDRDFDAIARHTSLRIRG